MYDKYLKELEERLDHVFKNMFGDDELSELVRTYIDIVQRASDLADLIIKIKTIQAMNVSAELIQASRRISRN